MAMDELQARALTTIATGVAVVFTDGEDAPLLVTIPPLKERVGRPPPDDHRIAACAAERAIQTGVDQYFFPRHFCAVTCVDAPEACAAAQRLIQDDRIRRALARTVLSTIEEAGALDRLWDDVLATIRARRPPGLDETALLRAFAGHGADWYAHRRGAQCAWSYAETEQFASALRDVLLAKIADPDGDEGNSGRVTLQAIEQQLTHRTFDPYPACSVICDQQPPTCRYRAAVADLVASGRYQNMWYAADAADAATTSDRKETWEVCQDAGYELIEFPEDDWPADLREHVADGARRTCLCFAQQMLADDARKIPRTMRKVLGRILAEAGL
jgi:hypothetical protein